VNESTVTYTTTVFALYAVEIAWVDDAGVEYKRIFLVPGESAMAATEAALAMMRPTVMSVWSTGNRWLVSSIPA
jgi:hypothetical protein